MEYTVEIIEAEPRHLAAVEQQFSFREVPTRLLSVLDQVWAFVRANGLTHGHNVVLYDEHGMTVAGVEVPPPLPSNERVRAVSTPTGRVATTAHFGEYSDLGPAHQAIFDYCQTNGLPMTRTHWEVYGDWSPDPATRRTDVFYLLG